MPLTGSFIPGYETYAGGNPSWYGANRSSVSQTRTPTTPNLPVAAVPTPASVGELSNLTKQINAMLLQGTKAAQAARVPGGPALEEQSSKVIGQELAGGVPDDVLKLLQQQGAEGAPGTGVNPQAAYLRALGLTSIGQQQAGEKNLTEAFARNPAAPIFDPATQLLTPGQAGNLALGQQQQNLAAQAEADRVALEQQRLALEGARAGGGGGGAQRGATSDFDPFITSVPNYGPQQAYTAATPGYGFSPSTAGETYTAQEPLTWDEMFGPGTAAA